MKLSFIHFESGLKKKARALLALLILICMECKLSAKCVLSTLRNATPRLANAKAYTICSGDGNALGARELAKATPNPRNESNCHTGISSIFLQGKKIASYCGPEIVTFPPPRSSGGAHPVLQLEHLTAKLFPKKGFRLGMHMEQASKARYAVVGTRSKGSQPFDSKTIRTSASATSTLAESHLAEQGSRERRNIVMRMIQRKLISVCCFRLP